MFAIYVIYREPIDYPGHPFVMRVHNIKKVKGERVVETTGKVCVGATLEDVRRSIPAGKTRRERADADEPQIVEWWV